MDDADLIAAARGGDTQAFGRLVVAHAPAVLRFVGGLAPLPRTEREDVVQEAFVRAYEKLETFETDRSFAAWVAGIARNVLCEHLGRVKRHEEARRKLVAAAAAEAGLRHAEQWTPRRAEIRMEALDECLEALPEPLRRVLHQHYREGVPLATLAQVLARPLNTVKTLLHRSRAEVRKCMDRKMLEASR